MKESMDNHDGRNLVKESQERIKVDVDSIWACDAKKGGLRRKVGDGPWVYKGEGEQKA